MPSAYAESRKDKEKVVREDIGGLMAELSRRPQTPERTRKLTGPERAAVLMLSLGEQYGAKIFGLLDDDDPCRGVGPLQRPRVIGQDRDGIDLFDAVGLVLCLHLAR